MIFAGIYIPCISITASSYYLFNRKQKYKNKIKLYSFGQNLGPRSPAIQTARPYINLNFMKNQRPDNRNEQHTIIWETKKTHQTRLYLSLRQIYNYFMWECKPHTYQLVDVNVVQSHKL